MYNTKPKRISLKSLLKELFLQETIQFYNSPDEDKPGNNQIVQFDDEIYPNIEGNTHGLVSHTIKHLSEFEPELVNTALTQAIQTITNEPNLNVKNVKNQTTIASGPQASKAMTPNAMLNTFDMINDKSMTGVALNQSEQKIKPIIDGLVNQYQRLINEFMSNAVESDNIQDADQIRNLINSKKIIKFTGIYGGRPNTYYINFENSGLLAVSGAGVATLFRIDKKGADLGKIAGYFSRGTRIENSALNTALDISSEDAPPPSRNSENAALQEMINVKRWQILAGLIKE